MDCYPIAHHNHKPYHKNFTNLFKHIIQHYLSILLNQLILIYGNENDPKTC